MIFVGHFSIDEEGSNDELRHGYLTCLVDAEKAETATEKFKQLLTDIHANEASATGWKAVYIEDIIEMASVPTHAVATHYQSSTGEFPKSISYTLPFSDNPDQSAYGLTEDIDRLAQDDENHYSEMMPFIAF